MVSAKVQLLGALATGVLATITAPTCSTCTISNGDAGCQSLQEAFPGKTFLPGHEVYDYEKTNFWSNHQILSPKCIFRPQSALDVAEAVVALKEDCTPFAVRGGGHMGIKVCISPRRASEASRSIWTQRVLTATPFSRALTASTMASSSSCPT